jgi:glutamyl-tRNA synthetase
MLTRFAPSPTGFLHMGNIRTALICYLYTKSKGGEFMLRIDDTDQERSEQRFVDAIFTDLEWLGIAPDKIEKQSDRFDRYDAAVVKLKAGDRLYPCYESQQELDMKRKMQMSQGRPPLYDRSSLKLTAEDIQAFEVEGRKPHWRFKLDQDQAVTWDDEIRGTQKFEMRHMSDPIVIRENGVYTYMLPSTVDDIELNVTHVLRGEDHVSNTAIQLQMFDALEGARPAFAHNSLIKTKDGKLSKRTGSQSIGDIRESGIQSLAVSSFLAKIGTSDPVELRETVEQMVAEFDISKFGRAPTIYEMTDIERLNAKLTHLMSFDDVKAELAELGLSQVDEEFWNAVRGNVENVAEVKEWWDICKQEITPQIEDAEFASKAASLLPAGEFDETTWKTWTDAVKTETGAKGKGLFMPLRKALTAQDHGPELKVILPLIGREKALARLEGKAA